MNLPVNIPIHEIEDRFIGGEIDTCFLKREDLIHEKISGNKWRKLYYNLKFAQSENRSTLVTFGGAYSNHIAATAAMAKCLGLRPLV